MPLRPITLAAVPGGPSEVLSDDAWLQLFLPLVDVVLPLLHFLGPLFRLDPRFMTGPRIVGLHAFKPAIPLLFVHFFQALRFFVQPFCQILEQDFRLFIHVLVLLLFMVDVEFQGRCLLPPQCNIYLVL